MTVQKNHDVITKRISLLDEAVSRCTDLGKFAQAHVWRVKRDELIKKRDKEGEIIRMGTGGKD